MNSKGTKKPCGSSSFLQSALAITNVCNRLEYFNALYYPFRIFRVQDPNGEIDQQRQDRMIDKLFLNCRSASHSSTKEKLRKSQSDGSFGLGLKMLFNISKCS